MQWHRPGHPGLRQEVVAHDEEPDARLPQHPGQVRGTHPGGEAAGHLIEQPGAPGAAQGHRVPDDERPTHEGLQRLIAGRPPGEVRERCRREHQHGALALRVVEPGGGLVPVLRDALVPARPREVGGHGGSGCRDDEQPGDRRHELDTERPHRTPAGEDRRRVNQAEADRDPQDQVELVGVPQWCQRAIEQPMECVRERARCRRREPDGEEEQSDEGAHREPTAVRHPRVRHTGQSQDRDDPRHDDERRLADQGVCRGPTGPAGAYEIPQPGCRALQGVERAGRARRDSCVLDPVEEWWAVSAENQQGEQPPQTRRKTPPQPPEHRAHGGAPGPTGHPPEHRQDESRSRRHSVDAADAPERERRAQGPGPHPGWPRVEQWRQHPGCDGHRPHLDGRHRHLTEEAGR